MRNSKSSVTVTCFLLGWAKELSAPLYTESRHILFLTEVSIIQDVS